MKKYFYILFLTATVLLPITSFAEWTTENFDSYTAGVAIPNAGCWNIEDTAKVSNLLSVSSPNSLRANTGVVSTPICTFTTANTTGTYFFKYFPQGGEDRIDYNGTDGNASAFFHITTGYAVEIAEPSIWTAIGTLTPSAWNTLGIEINGTLIKYYIDNTDNATDDGTWYDNGGTWYTMENSEGDIKAIGLGVYQPSPEAFYDDMSPILGGGGGMGTTTTATSTTPVGLKTEETLLIACIIIYFMSLWGWHTMFNVIAP